MKYLHGCIIHQLKALITSEYMLKFVFYVSK